MYQQDSENKQEELNERELAARLQQRDQKTLAALYDRYAPALMGLIRRIVDNPERAEVVLQKAFLTIWKKPETFRPDYQRLFTWMLGIARNAALKEVEAQKNHTNPEIRTVADSVSNGKLSVTPDMQKEPNALELVYFKGYSFAQAALELGCSREELKTRIRMELNQFRRVAVDE